jgi:Asp/Glu/hydantoin racemase
MSLLKKICVLVCACLLVACGESTPAESGASTQAPQVKEASTAKASPHSIQGMKNVMDDARSVEALLQKNSEDKRKKIDGYR